MNEQINLENYRISNILAEFISEKTRNRYETYIQAYDLKSLRYTGYIGGFIYTIFIILDYFIHAEIFSSYFFIRIILVGPLSLIALGLTFIAPFKDKVLPLQILGLSILSIAQIGHFLMASVDGTHPYYLLLSTCVLIVLGNTLMPLRFKFALVVNCFFLLLFQYVLFQIPYIDNLNLLLQNFVLISIMFVSLNACFLREKNKCRQFIQYDTLNLHKDLISKGNNELNETMGILSNKNKELEQFAYVISHDLKSPLRVISGISTLIERNKNNVLTDESKKDFEMIKDQIDQMNEMIEGVLQYSRIGRINNNIQSVNINRILDKIKYGINKQNVIIKYPENIPEVDCSQIHIHQVFQNLISNSIKYNSDEICEIEIDFSTENEKLICSVKDNGIGINPEFKERIFLLFQTLQPKSTENTGVGLAIVKKIVNHYKGEINLDTNYHDGAKFDFTLPLSYKKKAKEQLVLSSISDQLES